MPRSGINIVAGTETFKEFGNLVDVFKYSGRLTSIPFKAEDTKYMKAVWYFNDDSKFKQSISLAGQTIYADDFQEIVDNDLGPVHNWIPGWIDTRYTKDDWRKTWRGYTGIWSTDKGKRLEKILRKIGRAHV